MSESAAPRIPLLGRSVKREEGIDRALAENGNTCSAGASWQIEVYSSVSSTMDVARQVSHRVTAASPAVVLADEQTAGRGRQGRSWFSAVGGFAGTFVFRTDKPVQSMVGYSLVVGCVLRTVFQSLGAEVGLKWPNDVLSMDRRKVAGVLIELSTQADSSVVYTGIGINLVSSPREVPESTSLFALSGFKFTADDLLVRLAPVLFQAWQEFLIGGFPAFKDRWLEAALFSGEQLAFEVGDQVVRGRMVGIGDHGALLLDSGQGVVEVSSGHQIESGVHKQE